MYYNEVLQYCSGVLYLFTAEKYQKDTISLHMPKKNLKFGE